MFKPLSGLLILAVLSLLCAASAAGDQLVVDRPLHDSGPVRDGDIVQCVFTLSNAGTTPITVSSVSYNCSCTSYGFLLAGGGSRRAPYTVAPGESVDLQVTFRTAGYGYRPQPTAQVLTVTSDDSTRPSFPLTIQATVLTTLPSYLATASAFASEHFFLIDLREADAYAEAHLFGAINTPFSELDAQWHRLPAGRAYVLYDHDGALGAQAAAEMRDRGYYGVTFVNGGLVRWHAELGHKYVEWAEGIAPRAFVGSPIGGLYSQFPGPVASRYRVVVDLSSPEEFATSHVPGSVNLREDQLTAWLLDLERRLQLPDKTAFTLWLLDDVNGTASYRAVQGLVSLGYDAVAVQGGRDAVSQTTGGHLLWSFEPDE